MKVASFRRNSWNDPSGAAVPPIRREDPYRHLAQCLFDGAEDALLWGVDLSPDARTLAVADFYNGILFFDARTYEQVGDVLPVRAWVECVAYSPDGTTLAVGGDGFLDLIDVRTLEVRAHNQVSGHAARLEFTGDGRLVVLHDATLARTTNVEELYPERAPWNVADFTAAEIRRLYHVAD